MLVWPAIGVDHRQLELAARRAGIPRLINARRTSRSGPNLKTHRQFPLHAVPITDLEQAGVGLSGFLRKHFRDKRTGFAFGLSWIQRGRSLLRLALTEARG